MIIYKMKYANMVNKYFDKRIILRDQLYYQIKNKRGCWVNKKINSLSETLWRKLFFRRNDLVNPFYVEMTRFYSASNEIQNRIMHHIYIYFRCILKKGFTFVNVDNIYYFNFNDMQYDAGWINDYSLAYNELEHIL